MGYLTAVVACGASARPLVGRAVRPRVRIVSSAADTPAAEPSDDDFEQEQLEAGRRRMEEIFTANVTIDPRYSATERLLQQLFPSSQFVGGSESLPTKFVFVDEVTCIGCTHCAFVAPNTFMLEDDYGRARVFQQGGDEQELIEEAILCCPVSCIHAVSHTELVRLEEHRSEQLGPLQSKYWKRRLVMSEIGTRLSPWPVQRTRRPGSEAHPVRGPQVFRTCPTGGSP